MEDKNENNKKRRVGFEIEYAGVSLLDTANAVQALYGGEIREKTTALYQVVGTNLGDFTLELDAIPLQKLARKVQQSEQTSDKEASLVCELQSRLGKVIEDAGTAIVPYEIVAPPIYLRQISELESLCGRLRELGAKGTRSGFTHAFGLHINPEVISTETTSILRHLQSFLLLSPWLEQEHEIDFTRRMTSFIDPFPEPYFELILDMDYQPNFERFVKDYHRYNPVRDRALDMLPLFAHIDESLVRRLYGDEEKINPRPTFHYRLPNCEISQEDWSLNKEWQRWLHVEKVAANQPLFQTLLQHWQEHKERWFAMESDWIREVNDLLNEYAA